MMDSATVSMYHLIFRYVIRMWVNWKKIDYVHSKIRHRNVKWETSSASKEQKGQESFFTLATRLRRYGIYIYF